MDEPPGASSGLPRPFERVASLVELLTTFDKRLLNALDSLEEMRATLAGFESLGGDGEDLVADLKATNARLDARVNRDLDELKAAVLDRLDELDGVSARLDRLERAIFNIERATMHLDESFTGALELLPDFMSKRVRGSGSTEAPRPAPIDKEPPVS